MLGDLPSYSPIFSRHALFWPEHARADIIRYFEIYYSGRHFMYSIDLSS